MLFEAEWVLPITSAPIAEGAVRVEGGVITDVGTADALRAKYPGERSATSTTPS